MSRAIVLLAAVGALAAAGVAGSAPAGFTGSNGRILYEDGSYLVSMNPDGSGKARLHGAAAGAAPAWSPDGSLIAFQAVIRGDSDIYVVDAAGSRIREITFSRAFDGDPSWSPDGRRLAFESNRDGNVDVFTIGLDGSNETRLTTSAAFDGDPAWSPDGRQIVFTSDRDGRRTSTR